ncbi:hypothetical protein [Acidaminococcus timonensis]|nr:hypothetical protein [Acidaminococcus timonensis]
MALKQTGITRQMSEVCGLRDFSRAICKTGGAFFAPPKQKFDEVK